MAWTTPGTAVAGDVLTAAFWNEQVRDNLDELAPFFGAWTDWTPSLTATTTDPTLGTGSDSSGKYFQIGKVVVATVSITFGTSGTNAGDGFYRVSIPVTSAATGNVNILGFGRVLDNSTGDLFMCYLGFASTTTVDMVYANRAAGGFAVSHFAPFGWAASDQIRLSMIYQAA